MTRPRHPDVELRGSELLHEGRVFRLFHERLVLPSGLEQSLDLVDHPGAVAIVALDARGRMLLVRQYRHAVGDWTLEIPAGRLEADESIEEAARRELEEETGFEAAEWSLLRSIVPAAGFCSEVIHLFLATSLRPIPGGGAAADDDEELEVDWRRPEELLDGENRDAKTLIGAALVLRRGE